MSGTDLGDGYLKALGNPEGPHALACELVGSRLADWLGLSTFDFSLISVTDGTEVPFLKGGKAEPGPAFISRSEPKGFSWGGTVRELRRVVNLHEISGLILMDTWVLNCDRHSPDGKRVNLDNVFLIQQPGNSDSVALIAMDFTHAFTCGSEINRRIGFIERIRDERIYGRFPEFENFLNRESVRQYAARLSEFQAAVASQFVSDVPHGWQVDRESRAEWARFITERAHFLAERIEQIIWPQLELEGGTT
ncbi:MAG: HipA family kinase [Terracidiphilus sp.]